MYKTEEEITYESIVRFRNFPALFRSDDRHGFSEWGLGSCRLLAKNNGSYFRNE